MIEQAGPQMGETVNRSYRGASSRRLSTRNLKAQANTRLSYLVAGAAACAVLCPEHGGPGY